MPTGQSQFLVKIGIYPFQMAKTERLICGNFYIAQLDIQFLPDGTMLPTHEVPISALTAVEVFEHTGVPLRDVKNDLRRVGFCVSWSCVLPSRFELRGHFREVTGKLDS